jgi:hypothetical protein
VKKTRRTLIVNLGFAFLAVVALSSAQSKQTFTGIVTDDMCPRADHSQMRMGPSDAECSAACISEHGAVYVLFDGENAYTLSDQGAAKKFSAKKVKVTGALDSKKRTIQVESIAAAK